MYTTRRRQLCCVRGARRRRWRRRRQTGVGSEITLTPTRCHLTPSDNQCKDGCKTDPNLSAASPADLSPLRPPQPSPRAPTTTSFSSRCRDRCRHRRRRRRGIGNARDRIYLRHPITHLVNVFLTSADVDRSINNIEIKNKKTRTKKKM